MSEIADWMDKRITSIERYAKLNGRLELLLELKAMGVVRDSMLGQDWAVIFTEDGPKDIQWSKLKAEQ